MHSCKDVPSFSLRTVLPVARSLCRGGNKATLERWKLRALNVVRDTAATLQDHVKRNSFKNKRDVYDVRWVSLNFIRGREFIASCRTCNECCSLRGAGNNQEMQFALQRAILKYE
jgi:acetone carboxylase gamma subunit